VLVRGSGGGDAQVGLAFRQVKSLCATGEQGGERLARPESSLVHFGDVGDEVRLDAARLAEDLGQAAQEDVVGDRGERPALGFEGGLLAEGAGSWFSSSMKKGYASCWTG
jgi:hypothetical protein